MLSGRLLAWSWRLSAMLCLSIILAGCGGSSGSSSVSSWSASSSSAKPVSSASQSSSSSSTSSESSVLSSSSALSEVIISGLISYDWVPHKSHGGLDYAATSSRPARGVVVELVDESEQVLALTQTNDQGLYQLSAPVNQQVRVQAKAQLKRTARPNWNYSVTDNTRDNGLYVLAGSFADSGTTNSRRNLHADSGWDGENYTGVRAAAPFAIIDTLYIGIQRLLEVNDFASLGSLEFRWSSNNLTARHPDRDFSTGEIGTSFYMGEAIYLLGEANVDTDEYDRHVILHEWTHYLEDLFARSDTLGGEHGYGDRLDFRVALSEGLANAFAAMMLDDSIYRDAGGFRQASGFTYDLRNTTHINPGWFNEASIESVLFNYYLSDANKPAADFRYLFHPFISKEYRNTEALTSIYLFSEQLRTFYPETAPLLENLLLEQQIAGRGIFGEGEANNPGESDLLPIYKTLDVNGAPVTVCSTGMFGVYNKLGVAQFLRTEITQRGTYRVTMSKTNGGTKTSDETKTSGGLTDPDFSIFRRGLVVARGQSSLADQEAVQVHLEPGVYIIEAYDWNNRSPEATGDNRSCFNLVLNAHYEE